MEKTPGIATSVYAMTPLQGLELVDPTAQREKQEEEAQSYFSSSSSFVNVKK